jgi:ribose transport system ATP-binding protein
VDEATLVEEMAGRPIDRAFPVRTGEPADRIALRVKDFSVPHPHIAGRDVVHRVSFDVRAGEILGIAGLVGSGRTELLSGLFGRLPHHGVVEVDGQVRRIRSPRDAKRAGIALLSEDRAGEGMLFNLDIRRNISIGNLPLLSQLGFLRTGQERQTSAQYMRSLAVKAPTDTTRVTTLSGGNQQKIVLARVLLAQPRIVLLDEPTKGVDVATKQEIYRLVHGLAAEGIALVIVSSELPELLSLCDRSIVLADGEQVDEFSRADASEARVVAVSSRGRR